MPVTIVRPVVPEIAVPGGLRFVFPHAPVRPVTINGGFAMRAWYDITALDAAPPTDVAGFEASVRGVTKLIHREIVNGIPQWVHRKEQKPWNLGDADPMILSRTNR